MPDFNRDPREKRMSLDEIEAAEQAEMAEKKKFNLFSRAYRDGKGVDKEEAAIADNPTFINFFRLCWRKINELLSVNLISIVGNFPIFFFLFAMSGYMSIHTTSPNYAVYGPLWGAKLFHNSPAVSAQKLILASQISSPACEKSSIRPTICPGISPSGTTLTGNSIDCSTQISSAAVRQSASAPNNS